MRFPTFAVAAVITTFDVVVATVMYRCETHRARAIIGFGLLSAGIQMGATLATDESLDCQRVGGVTELAVLPTTNC